MKRSEALAIIDKTYEEFVSDWLKADISNLQDFMPLNERILLALEEAGMLPPPFSGKVKIEPTEEGLAVKIWGWESE